jgi:hypothetical protein
MAEEIRREKVFGNFRPPLRERLKKKPSAASKREGNSEAHLACIRQLPCCCCLRMDRKSDPHHLLSAGERAFGQKATDRLTVPLCRFHHDELHQKHGTRGERAFFASFGIDPLELANALFGAARDVGRMLKIVLAHRAQGAKK